MNRRTRANGYGKDEVLKYMWMEGGGCTQAELESDPSSIDQTRGMEFFSYTPLHNSSP